MRARGVLLGLTVLAAHAGGCTSWSRLNAGEPIPDRGTVQIWSAGQHILLRDPETVGDSLVGRRALPDTVRSAVALTTIDSLRVQTTDIGKSVIVGTGVALALLLAYTQGLEGMK